MASGRRDHSPLAAMVLGNAYMKQNGSSDAGRSFSAKFDTETNEEVKEVQAAQAEPEPPQP